MFLRLVHQRQSIRAPRAGVGVVYYRKVDLSMQTPFHNSSGEICFSWSPVSDRVFIYRLPTPQKFDPKGTILIPDVLKEHFQPEIGVLLAIGPGYYNEKGKYQAVSKDLKPGVLVSFDPNVPWSVFNKGVDGRFYKVVVCGEKDILGVVDE